MTDETPTLPAADAIQTFADTVNTARERLGLPPVSRWDISGSEPGSMSKCLSARHLIGPLLTGESVAESPDPWAVGSFRFGLSDDNATQRLAYALDTETHKRPGAISHSVVIPDEIRGVTDYFDQIDFDHDPTGWHAPLVDAFVAAGLEAS